MSARSFFQFKYDSLEDVTSPLLSGKQFHLFSPNIYEHDAVSRHLLETAAFLERSGANVTLYCDGCIDDDRNWIQSTQKLIERQYTKNDALLYFFSIGHAIFDSVKQLDCKKILYFHGVTPPELIEKDFPLAAQYCQLGYQQLEDIYHFDAFAANSLYTKNSIVNKSKDRPVSYLPPFIDMEWWNDLVECKPKTANALESSNIKLLYVGRIFPHKNIIEMLTVVNSLKELEPSVCLFIVGFGHSEDYLNKVKTFIDDQELNSNVIFFEDVSDAELKWFYANSNALINFSAHEGFGVPFVEAMKFKLPIDTYEVAAIPFTVVSYGAICGSKEPR
ncbi:MAG: glycosyltransferase [Bdellovibrionales bacterium]